MECFLKLKDVGLNQTREIKKYMNNEEMAKNSAHILLQELVIGFWRDVQFIQRLGNNRFKGYATSIARMAFDKCIRLIYLTKQKSPKDQDRLAELELMRTSRKFYFIELNNGEEKNAKKWKDFYNLVKRNTDEEVDASDKKIKSFLDTKSMLQKSQFSDWEKVYINYGFLCEDIHGGLFKEPLKNKSKTKIKQ